MLYSLLGGNNSSMAQSKFDFEFSFFTIITILTFYCVVNKNMGGS